MPTSWLEPDTESPAQGFRSSSSLSSVSAQASLPPYLQGHSQSGAGQVVGGGSAHDGAQGPRQGGISGSGPSPGELGLLASTKFPLPEAA